jgi:hypothetical protein
MVNASTPLDTRSVNAFAASVLLSGAVLCGAQALADDATVVPTQPDAPATHRKLMKECMDKQRSQNEIARPEETRQLCTVRVKTQLQQLKDAGAMPVTSVPPSPAGIRQ